MEGRNSDQHLRLGKTENGKKGDGMVGVTMDGVTIDTQISLEFVTANDPFLFLQATSLFFNDR